MDLREDWVTPVQNFESLNLIAITLRDALEILVDASPDLKCKFVWESFYSYRVTSEENGPPWKIEKSFEYLRTDEGPKKINRTASWGKTNLVRESSWIAGIKQEDGFLELLHPNARHFVLITTEYVIEVLSRQEPRIETVA